MVKRPSQLTLKDVKELLQSQAGQVCSIKRIGSNRSLFIGFGDVETSGIQPHARMEIGSYDCSWRVIRQDEVICGKDDAVDRLSELQDALLKIDFGGFVDINQISEFDIRVGTSTGVCVDILCTISDDDETLHIFFPDKQVLTFQATKGWRLGRSDEPWS